MSQAQLAGTELTKGFISQLESGLVRPSIRSLQVIASRLGKPLDYFLGDQPLSLQKRVEFFHLAAQAAFEREAWDDLTRVAEDALSLGIDARQRAEFLRWQGEARVRLRDTEGGFAAAEEALRLLDESSDPAGVAASLQVQGIAYMNSGQTAAAAQVFERALGVVERHEVLDTRLRIRLCLNCGSCYRRLNRTTRAVQLFEKALALASRSSDLRHVAIAFMGIAVGLYDSGELDGAIANYRRALEFLRRVSDQELELSVLHSLAAVRYQQGDVAEAEEYARQCRDRAVVVGNERMVAIAETELARVALAGGQAETAIETARVAEQVLDRVGETRQRASALRVVGAGHHALGQHAESDRHYTYALELLLSIERYADASEVAAEYAQKLRERGEYERAFHYLELSRRHVTEQASA